MPVGLLLNPQQPPGVSATEVWRGNFAVARLAEAAGFHSVHVPEHHGRPDGHMPQPLLACAALAGATERIRIGTTVTLPALRHPVHLAEELSVLDVVSGGRAELGVGIGNYAPEFAMFGLDAGTSIVRFSEAMRALLRLLEGPGASFEGEHFRFEGVTTMPRPVQKPHPPVWIGAFSAAGARRAARLGVGLLLDPIHSMSELTPVADAYHEACAAHGTVSRLTLMRWVGLHRRREALRDEWWPRFSPLVATYTTEIPRVAVRNGEDLLDFETYAADRLLVGDADTVSHQAREWLDAVRGNRLVVKLQGPGGPWNAELHAVIEEFATDVLPTVEAISANEG